MANELAYGFVGMEHLANERVSVVGYELVWDAVRESVAEHTRQVNAMTASMVEPTTTPSVRFYQPGSGTLQPLDEYGVPKPVREEGYYDVAFPIQGGGTAWGDNRVSRALITVEEANRRTLNVLRRDADWMKRHILASVFEDDSWSFDDPEHGSLTVQPLANGDTVEYLKVDGDPATDTHYLAQAAAISDDANPFDDIYNELMEHPINQGGPIVVYIPTNLKTTVMGLTGFTEVLDPDITPAITTATLNSVFDRGPGHEVLGKTDKCWIIEWRSLPDSYMFAHARGGGPILRMRQYPAAELQGLFTEGFTPDGNLQQTSLIRYAGFGAINRVGAVVYRVGNASYAVPTGYTAPLPL